MQRLLTNCELKLRLNKDLQYLQICSILLRHIQILPPLCSCLTIIYSHLQSNSLNPRTLLGTVAHQMIIYFLDIFFLINSQWEISSEVFFLSSNLDISILFHLYVYGSLHCELNMWATFNLIEIFILFCLTQFIIGIVGLLFMCIFIYEGFNFISSWIWS